MAFVKLFSTITESSLWSESKETRVLFVTMLAKADATGFVEAALPGLARVSNLSLEETRVAVAQLEGPDPHSKNPANEGRRVIHVPERGGWQILNYAAYRERRNDEERQAYMRQYMKQYRAKNKNGGGELCAYCGDEATELDHIIPKANGGTEDNSNLAPCCGTCNSSKKAYGLVDWLTRKNLVRSKASLEVALENANVRRAYEFLLADVNNVSKCKPYVSRGKPPLAHADGEADGEAEVEAAAIAALESKKATAANQDLFSSDPSHSGNHPMPSPIGVRNFGDWRVSIGLRVWVDRTELTEWHALWESEGWDSMTKGYKILCGKIEEPKKIHLSHFLEIRK